MTRKDHIDAAGVVALVGFSAVLGLNQVVVKVVNDGLQPVFAAGLRSCGAAVLLYLYLRATGRRPTIERDVLPWGLVQGALFGTEFMLLYWALDLTTVARASVVFYTMPVWLAVMAHLAIPGERIGPRKALGLALAVAGVAWAILDRDGAGGGAASLLGDLLALVAAFCWAGIALVARVTPFSRIEPAMQLSWQVTVSAVLLILAAPLFGPLVRDFAPVHAWGMGFQIVVVATGAFLFWFWLLKIYPASGVASFSFLSPVFGVFFGWLLLGERVGTTLWAALVLVAAGLVLINRPPRRQETSTQIGR